MKTHELLDLVTRPSFERTKDNELCIDISKPSIGPTRVCGVKYISHGFDWDSGKTIIRAVEKLVVKSEGEELYDASTDLMWWLWKDGFKKQRKPWYFDRVKSVYKRAGILEQMTEYAEKDSSR